MSLVQKKYLDYLNSKEGALKFNEFKNILYGPADSLVEKLFTIILPELKKRKKIKILDVGGADGKRLMHLIDLFSKYSVDVNATLVEPSRSFVASLRKSLKNKEYKIKISNSKFENFKSVDKYDLIMFIHGTYTFKDDKYLEKAKKLLNSRGVIIFVVNGDNSFLADLKKVTDTKFHSKRKELPDVINDLNKSGCRYRIKKFDTKFDGLTGGIGLSAKGKLILEWISLIPYKKISDVTKEKALDVILQHTKKGKIIETEVVIMAK